MFLYALRDLKSGKLLAIDFDERDNEVKRKYHMLLNRKALPPLMLTYPEDFECVKCGTIKDDTLEIKEISHEVLFRLNELKEAEKDGKATENA